MKINDNRFLRLIENLLRAGYLEDWRPQPTFSGTPQGGMVSPILSNVYLDRLDQFVEQTLIPEYTEGQTTGGEPGTRAARAPVKMLPQVGAGR